MLKKSRRRKSPLRKRSLQNFNSFSLKIKIDFNNIYYL